jgi:hypothetical protein
MRERVVENYLATCESLSDDSDDEMDEVESFLETMGDDGHDRDHEINQSGDNEGSSRHTMWRKQ